MGCDSTTAPLIYLVDDEPMLLDYAELNMSRGRDGLR
jgi:hypothetical protein